LDFAPPPTFKKVASNFSPILIGKSTFSARVQKSFQPTLVAPQLATFSFPIF
jgi:hypothetical protein